MQQSVNIILKHADARRPICLIGYSGGALVCSILASRLTEINYSVVCLVACSGVPICDAEPLGDLPVGLMYSSRDQFWCGRSMWRYWRYWNVVSWNMHNANHSCESLESAVCIASELLHRKNV